MYPLGWLRRVGFRDLRDLRDLRAIRYLKVGELGSNLGSHPRCDRLPGLLHRRGSAFGFAGDLVVLVVLARLLCLFPRFRRLRTRSTLALERTARRRR